MGFDAVVPILRRLTVVRVVLSLDGPATLSTASDALDL